LPEQVVEKQLARARVLAEFYDAFERDIALTEAGIARATNLVEERAREAVRYLRAKGLLTGSTISGTGIDLYEAVALGGDPQFAARHDIAPTLADALLKIGNPAAAVATPPPAVTAGPIASDPFYVRAAKWVLWYFDVPAVDDRLTAD